MLAQVIGVAGHLCRIGSPLVPPRRPLQGSELFLAPTSCVIVLTWRCCGFAEFGNHRCLFTFGLVGFHCSGMHTEEPDFPYQRM
ncbi:hypothetical protein TNIN_463191 [Trichonephila inaurata madagascariensis]|uniref:Uncharacterized protein n=1 Tax=Trichonephila inaurata madagascariensis TaxID=2747483 RepID=A0A8X7CCI3_9ARAC|nr:hypothetical protein TNIN_463191 [Trichonephila inaurata madagascariensis]